MLAKEEARNEIIKNLLNEEVAENNLIALYLAFLEAGVEKCIKENLRAAFKYDLDILYRESEKHKKIVQEIIKKYQNQN